MRKIIISILSPICIWGTRQCLTRQCSSSQANSPSWLIPFICTIGRNITHTRCHPTSTQHVRNPLTSRQFDHPCLHNTHENHRNTIHFNPVIRPNISGSSPHKKRNWMGENTREKRKVRKKKGWMEELSRWTTCWPTSAKSTAKLCEPSVTYAWNSSTGWSPTIKPGLKKWKR